MALNQKDLRIRKLYQKGIHDPATIARKIGYQEHLLQDGIARVKEAFHRLGINDKNSH